ncbi:MAG: hypothetical protein WBE26_20210 [Phycisphaerae bacterium]
MRTLRGIAEEGIGPATRITACGTTIALPEWGRSVVYWSIIYWFFPRKAKIAFLTLMVYAALC